MQIFVDEINGPSSIKVIAEMLGAQSKFHTAVVIVAITCSPLFIIKIGRVGDLFGI